MNELLNISKLSIGYTNRKNTTQICHSLNASLKQGELVCLLGANGKGKSTLIKTICGFIQPLRGEISILGKDINKINEQKMSRKISVVLTERLIVPNATVEELVGYGRSPYTGFMGRLLQADMQIVKNAMEQCDISHKANNLVSSLSDGERQKASIAKALAQDTPIILLDEPTAFLDLPSRVEIIKLLRQLATNSGKAILMSTHDLDLALQMADRLWLMHTDKIHTGSPEDLIYRNAFQQFFEKDSISFDNKTCSFKVEHENKQQFAIKGNGFEYDLLCRAFSRQGVEAIKYDGNQSNWLNIETAADAPFQFYVNNTLKASSGSIEQIIKESKTIKTQ